MKKALLSLVFLLIALLSYSQQTLTADSLKQWLCTVDTIQYLQNIEPVVFGEPRKPHENSFYNESMWIDDWAHTEFNLQYSKEELSLFGLESRVETSGRTIVYDASVNTVYDNIQLQGTNGVTIDNSNAFVEVEGRMLQIPINFIGDNTIVEKNLDKKDREEVTQYINSSLMRAGCTPSNIDIKVSNKDFDLFIFKSKFTDEDFIVRRLNLRTTQIFKINNDFFVLIAFR